MQKTQTDVLIIGAGLTGLTLAYLLKKYNINFTVVEGRKRLGGRILTAYTSTNTPIELGATWLIEQQTSALQLLKELDIQTFEQYYGNTAIYCPNDMQNAQLVNLPNNNAKSYRISNGTYSLIDSLATKIGSESIKTNEAIHTIKNNDNHLVAFSNDSAYYCKYIVSTLPPQLLKKSISIVPHLPENINTLLSNTHTWMHDSIRVGITYTKAFWKTNGTTGTIYSSVGPIKEFYDHSNATNNRFALSGFVNDTLTELTKNERKNAIINQLKEYYGEIALNFMNYEECIWLNESYTTVKSGKKLMPQTNNGHPLFQNTFLDNRLFIAGTETSPVFPGKMEGAVVSANSIFDKLKSLI